MRGPRTASRDCPIGPSLLFDGLRAASMADPANVSATARSSTSTALRGRAVGARAVCRDSRAARDGLSGSFWKCGREGWSGLGLFQHQVELALLGDTFVFFEFALDAVLQPAAGFGQGRDDEIGARGRAKNLAPVHGDPLSNFKCMCHAKFIAEKCFKESAFYDAFFIAQRSACNGRSTGCIRSSKNDLKNNLHLPFHSSRVPHPSRTEREFDRRIRQCSGRPRLKRTDVPRF